MYQTASAIVRQQEKDEREKEKREKERGGKRILNDLE